MKRVSDIVGNFLGFVGDVAALITGHPLIFWLIIAGLALILVLIIIVVSNDKKRKKQKSPHRRQRSTVFVPIETPGADIDVEYLTLKDKIIAAEGQLGRKLVEKIKNKGPQALPDIVAAYDKSKPEIKNEIKQLVKDERLLERYSRRLTLPDYSQAVLLEAWARFPNTDTLKDFVEMLASPDEGIQLAGTRLLSAMKDPQCLTVLTAALMWPEHFVPARVAEVFASMGTQGARLLAYLLPKIDDKHKIRVLETIAKSEAPFPCENVGDCLRNGDPAIRAAAALALGSGRMTEGLEPLIFGASIKTGR